MTISRKCFDYNQYIISNFAEIKAGVSFVVYICYLLLKHVFISHPNMCRSAEHPDMHNNKFIYL